MFKFRNLILLCLLLSIVSNNIHTGTNDNIPFIEKYFTTEKAILTIGPLLSIWAIYKILTKNEKFEKRHFLKDDDGFEIRERIHEVKSWSFFSKWWAPETNLSKFINKFSQYISKSLKYKLTDYTEDYNDNKKNKDGFWNTMREANIKKQEELERKKRELEKEEKKSKEEERTKVNLDEEENANEEDDGKGIFTSSHGNNKSQNLKKKKNKKNKRNRNN